MHIASQLCSIISKVMLYTQAIMAQLHTCSSYFIQITDNELFFGESEPQTKQGRFLCKQCGRYIYHATTLVTHYENKHDESLGVIISFVAVIHTIVQLIRACCHLKGDNGFCSCMCLYFNRSKENKLSNSISRSRAIDLHQSSILLSKLWSIDITRVLWT